VLTTTVPSTVRGSRAATPVSIPPAGPAEAARAARLQYVSDAMPGIRRRRAGKGFVYVGPDGHPVRDAGELRRIRSLAIPPAWTDVWICPSPRGHLQATGRDAKGRKQYRYHPRWREVRDETKYDRMIAFGEALPRIRARVADDLGLPGLPRERVLAAIVALLDRTFIRVGNEEYARENGSYGLTTLRDKHVDIAGAEMVFHFRGKSGKEHTVDLRDRRLARIVQRCRDLPGYELFQYVDEQGERQAVDSSDVNEYLRAISGDDFTAKDFRTWAGTVLAACALGACGPCETATQTKHNVVEAIKSVAARLGNTPAVCRKSYVHPAVLDGYADGSLLSVVGPAAAPKQATPLEGLSADEACVLEFLWRCQSAASAAVQAAS
jgi:DNA topoisomerase-1